MDEEKKKMADDFVRMTLTAKARAYANVSLKRPLSNREFKEYKDTMRQLGFSLP